MNLESSSPEPHGDLDWAQRILAGDAAEFERFVDQLMPAAQKFVGRRLRRPDQVEDIVQNSICKAIENLENYRGEAPLVMWALGICRFELMATYRKNRRVPEQSSARLSEVEGALEMLRDPATGPEHDALRREVGARVHEVLDDLPPRYGQILRWKYHEQIPVQQIADRLGLSAKAAESTLTRARVAFRKAFDPSSGHS